MNNFKLGGLMLRIRKAVIGGPLSEGMKSIEKLQPLLPPPQQASSSSFFFLRDVIVIFTVYSRGVFF